MSSRVVTSVPNFLIVTERGGEPITAAQLERLFQRYVWAGAYCQGKDVAEFACGTGPGLGYLSSVSKSLRAGDISADVLREARGYYGARVDLRCFPADKSPYDDASLDVVILFEAIYYLPDLDSFLREVLRVVRPGGCLLLATANKDLPDFNPSPFSNMYLNPPEITHKLTSMGFRVEFFGGSPVAQSGLFSRVFRFAKRMAVSLHLIPRSMKGKRFLKRLVFGKLVIMPNEFTESDARYVPPVAISSSKPDLLHQVIYCAATRNNA